LGKTVERLREPDFLTSLGVVTQRLLRMWVIISLGYQDRRWAGNIRLYPLQRDVLLEVVRAGTPESELRDSKILTVLLARDYR